MEIWRNEVGGMEVWRNEEWEWEWGIKKSELLAPTFFIGDMASLT